MRIVEKLWIYFVFLFKYNLLVESSRGDKVICKEFKISEQCLIKVQEVLHWNNSGTLDVFTL